MYLSAWQIFSFNVFVNIFVDFFSFVFVFVFNSQLLYKIETFNWEIKGRKRTKGSLKIEKIYNTNFLEYAYI